MSPAWSAPTFSWQGNAPSCGASPSDCSGATPYFWGYNNSGDGAPCWTGNKVLCGSEPISDYQNLQWEGKAPFCDAKASDCPADTEFLVQGTSGDGSQCDNGGVFSGHKVYCGGKKPLNSPMDVTNSKVIDQISANQHCPQTCSGFTWNGQFAPSQANPQNMLCGATLNIKGSKNISKDIPVGYFSGQSGANATCQQRISKMNWNGQWNQGICGCQPATLIPK
jgi:hypothetical protein